MFLNILGTDTVDNYHQDFITKLYQRYNAEDTIQIMADKNLKFFYQFAKAWPRKHFPSYIRFRFLEEQYHSEYFNKLENG